MQRAPAPPPGATLLLQGHGWRPHLQHRDLPRPGPNPGSSAPELGFKLCQLESPCLRVLASWRRQTLHWLARQGKHSGQDPVSRAESQPTELAAGDRAGRPAKHGALLAPRVPSTARGKSRHPPTHNLWPFERAWPCPQHLLLKDQSLDPLLQAHCPGTRSWSGERRHDGPSPFPSVLKLPDRLGLGPAQRQVCQRGELQPPATTAGAGVQEGTQSQGGLAPAGCPVHTARVPLTLLPQKLQAVFPPPDLSSGGALPPGSRAGGVFGLRLHSASRRGARGISSELRDTPDVCVCVGGSFSSI